MLLQSGPSKIHFCTIFPYQSSLRHALGLRARHIGPQKVILDYVPLLHYMLLYIWIPSIVPFPTNATMSSGNYALKSILL